MDVNPEVFRSLLDKATFKENGDGYEQNFGHVVSHYFPNCERFWSLFIVPLTERLSGYPSNLSEGIKFRESLAVQLEEISFAHYSAFLNLVYAHQHLNFNMLCSLEDLYVHLGCACDLVETFLEKSYLLLLKCRTQQTTTLERLTKEEFLKIAEDWYDKSYSVVYEYYLAKGKFPPIKLPAREHLFKEFISNYLGQSVLWNNYQRYSKSIREFRNVIVHDVQIGRILTPNGLFVPKPTLIQKGSSRVAVIAPTFSGCAIGRNRRRWRSVSSKRKVVPDVEAAIYLHSAGYSRPAGSANRSDRVRELHSDG